MYLVQVGVLYVRGRQARGLEASFRDAGGEKTIKKVMAFGRGLQLHCKCPRFCKVSLLGKEAEKERAAIE